MCHEQISEDHLDKEPYKLLHNNDNLTVEVDSTALGDDVKDIDLPELTEDMAIGLRKELEKTKPSCRGKCTKTFLRWANRTGGVLYMFCICGFPFPPIELPDGESFTMVGTQT